MERVNDTFLLVGRILIAALFLSAGIPKALQGYGGGFAQYLASMGVPFADIVAVVAVAVEVLGPVALILGIFPRISALLLIAFTVAATLLAHRYWEFPGGGAAGPDDPVLQEHRRSSVASCATSSAAPAPGPSPGAVPAVGRVAPARA